MQPDDEEIEEEFEIEETESKPATRPASKLDLEEPISNSQNEDDGNEDEDDEDGVNFYLHTLICFNFGTNAFSCQFEI